MRDLLPGPPEPDGRDDAHNPAPEGARSQEPPGRPRRKKIPSVEDCLSALAELAGLVAVHYIKPAHANAIRAIFTEILRYHQRNESRADGRSLADEDLGELLRKDPSVLNLLEPFLTDEQISTVMRRAKEGDGNGHKS